MTELEASADSVVRGGKGWRISLLCVALLCLGLLCLLSYFNASGS